MTNGPKSIQARVKAYEKFPGAAAIFVKKCSKTGQKASEGNPKVPQLSIFFLIRKHWPKRSRQALQNSPKVRVFSKKIFAKMQTKKQPSPPAAAAGSRNNKPHPLGVMVSVIDLRNPQARSAICNSILIFVRAGVQFLYIYIAPRWRSCGGHFYKLFRQCCCRRI